MHSDKQVFIDSILARLTLEQKVGQCFVLGMVGAVPTPLIRRRIREICPAGIRSGHGLRNKTATHDPSIHPCIAEATCCHSVRPPVAALHQ